jgi:aspartokinase-like uncharacterized kinase
VDAVIKVGGSLAEDPERLIALCKKLCDLAEKHTLVIVPGGGKFADAVRNYDAHFTLSKGVSHRMAILGMDQFGLLLSDIMRNSRVFNRLEDAEELYGANSVLIFLPSQFMFGENPLENSWDVTSDSIAAYVASRLQIATVILATDVDGILTGDPKRHPDAKLLPKLQPEELLELGQRTSVDRCLPKLFLSAKLNCYVVNGNFPDRIEAILAGRRTTCTVIASRTRRVDRQV